MSQDLRDGNYAAFALSAMVAYRRVAESNLYEERRLIPGERCLLTVENYPDTYTHVLTTADGYMVSQPLDGRYRLLSPLEQIAEVAE